MKIVTSLTEQIEGEIKLERGNGTKFTIFFKNQQIFIKISDIKGLFRFMSIINQISNKSPFLFNKNQSFGLYFI